MRTLAHRYSGLIRTFIVTEQMGGVLLPKFQKKKKTTNKGEMGFAVVLGPSHLEKKRFDVPVLNMLKFGAVLSEDALVQLVQDAGPAKAKTLRVNLGGIA
jgi:hypothetical protein